MAIFVPNLKPRRALVGGGIGGALGAFGFIWAAATLDDLIGRFIGAGVLGLSIGLMVALAETIFRRAWLEISYGANESRTVSLGKWPVSIGSDKSCTVYARNVSAIDCSFKLDRGQIVCQEGHNQKSVDPGFQKTVGNVTVTVCAPASKNAPPSSGGGGGIGGGGGGSVVPKPSEADEVLAEINRNLQGQQR